MCRSEARCRDAELVVENAIGDAGEARYLDVKLVVEDSFSATPGDAYYVRNRNDTTKDVERVDHITRSHSRVETMAAAQGINRKAGGGGVVYRGANLSWILSRYQSWYGHIDLFLSIVVVVFFFISIREWPALVVSGLVYQSADVRCEPHSRLTTAHQSLRSSVMSSSTVLYLPIDSIFGRLPSHRSFRWCTTREPSPHWEPFCVQNCDKLYTAMRHCLVPALHATLV